MKVFICFLTFLVTQARSDPCNGVTCEFNAVCVGNGTCECQNFCPFIYAPVCGSDGQTYSNECVMKAKSCSQKKIITKLSDGNCPTQKATQDPCAGMTCNNYGICSVVGGVAKCQCQNFCPLIYAPVCGSDGQTYSNECEMKAKSCSQNKLITKVSNGNCPTQKPTQSQVDLCANVTCAHYAMCSVIGGAAKCQCPLICPAIYAPVCGSNGKTYSNECGMKAESCSQKYTITKDSDGACPCDSHKCDHNAQCINKAGKAICQCPLMCTLEFAPVCGSDGKTYPNECSMRVAGCNKKMTLAVDSRGACPCDTTTCPNNGRCVNQKGNATCTCMIPCPRDFRPVCGSDGKTYSNECTMRAASCNQERMITIDSNGECPCDRTKCAFNGRCVNQKGNATCTCMIPCPRIYDPVCGSDGKMYSNECMMRVASCEKKVELTAVASGECNKPTKDALGANPTSGSLQLSACAGLLIAIFAMFAVV